MKIILSVIMLAIMSPAAAEEPQLEEPPTIEGISPFARKRVKYPRELKTKFKKVKEVKKEEVKPNRYTQEVAFTSFTGSRMGSGRDASSFGVNDLGMSIDGDGYVVVATATNECLRSNDPGCARYTSVPNGYTVWSYGDTFTIKVGENRELKAKVYDSCGACFWDEAYQRVDIHMPNRSLGKVRGQLSFE